MRSLLVRYICVLPLCAYAAAQSNTSLAGDWAVTTDVFGTPLQQILILKSEGNKLTGTLSGRGHAQIDGTTSGNSIHFIVKQDKDTTGDYEGTLSGEWSEPQK